MELKPGTRLGQYEILALIGKGGMGEVYHGFDTKLKRDVALKVLPAEFARDPDRLGRFRREATLLASLNHPNIAQIYGVEDSGETHALVMEYVPGETLAHLIRDSGLGTRGSGGLPVEEVLRIATQVVEALEHAHEKAIIHRDLKPANVKLTPEGQVKVLDFGLAKAFAGDGSGASDHFDSQSPTVLTASPTLPGVILGTAAYMSPEQARGKPVDKRTDIWAFGCVLYELLAGKQAFQARGSGLGVRDSGNADTIPDILARVLQAEPDWSALPANTPWRVKVLLRRCLEKDKTLRLRDAGDARLDLSEALTSPVPVSPTPVPQIAAWRRPVAIGMAAAGLIVLSGIATWYLRPTAPAGIQTVSRFVIPLLLDESFAPWDCPTVAMSPHGNFLAYVTVRGGRHQLYVRAMDSLETRAIPGIERRVHSPFFSPDGQWLGFWADGELKKISTTGGSSISLARIEFCGATWGADDNILLGMGQGLSRIAATGGTPQNLTAADSANGESQYFFPEFLPGGKAMLFTVVTSDANYDEAQIVVQRLDTRERHVLIQGASHAQFIPTGHLVYAKAGKLLAAPFDLGRLEITGSAVTVVEGLMRTQQGFSQFFISPAGSLAYVQGELQEESLRTLVWVDRSGKEQPLGAPARAYLQPRISPDGRTIVSEIEQGTTHDVWTYNVSRGVVTRLTFNGDSHWPSWTPDGRRISFASGPNRNLFWKPADGSRAEERLTTGELRHNAASWSPDGQTLAYSEEHPDTGLDLWILQIQGDRKPRAFLQTRFNETLPSFSPDGRWLAYVSDESGQNEVYVQPFPGPDGKWQISIEGGQEPVWARNGRELFYRSGNRIMGVNIATQPGFSAGRPELLFETQYVPRAGGRANFDVSPDGQRFLMIQPVEPEQAATQIHMVLNWFEELRRRVPVRR
jgi:serine/threonine-protein kinase